MTPKKALTLQPCETVAYCRMRRKVARVEAATPRRTLVWFEGEIRPHRENEVERPTDADLARWASEDERRAVEAAYGAEKARVERVLGVRPYDQKTSLGYGFVPLSERNYTVTLDRSEVLVLLARLEPEG